MSQVDTPIGPMENPGLCVIFSMPTMWHYRALRRVLKEVAGVQPTSFRDDGAAERAFYKSEAGFGIVNLPSAEMRAHLGPHEAVLPMFVSDPRAAADRAVEIFGECEIPAVRKEQGPGHDLPPDFMWFVSVDGWGVPLLFWPAQVSEDVKERARRKSSSPE